MDKFIEKWLCIFGPPKSILTDNGREFVNDHFIKLTEAFSITIKSKAEYSPWSDGICERWVGLIKDGLRKLRVDCVGDKREIVDSDE